MENQAILNTGQKNFTDEQLKQFIEAKKGTTSRTQRRIAAGNTKSKPYRGGNITSNNYKQLN